MRASTNAAGSWEATRLWKLICERRNDTDAVRLTLLNSLPKIELVLSAGGAALPDFTLHDHEHAFRVAERMHDLLPDDVVARTGTFELALLLLSAYLHDIGMSPKREVVRKHYQYILTAGADLLSSSEIASLQNWLDQERGGLELPIATSAISPNGIRDADEILSYYCRARHNDWGESWVREELAETAPGLYATWIDDLVTLCRSHHDGLLVRRKRI